jgi:hypothetical protein
VYEPRMFSYTCTELYAVSSPFLSPDSPLAQTDTKEGLDICISLQYYSRIRLIQNLLPLLRKSPRPRALSVLNAGWERKMIDEDIGLSNAANYGITTVVPHTTTLMTLGLEYFADRRLLSFTLSLGLCQPRFILI